MEVEEFEPEFYELPRGTTGLPDLLIFSRKRVNGIQSLLRAYIVKPKGDGFWCERYFVEDKDGMDWALTYATEKVRQQVVVQQPTGTNPAQAPFQVTPFEDWRALAVQFEMGFYQGLGQVGRKSDDMRLVSRLREAIGMPEVHTQVESFQP